MLDDFYTDDIKAIDARFEAQKIAFSPIVFQAAKCMIDFNILNIIENSGENGITEEDILKNISLSPYALSVLLELSLGLCLIKIVKNSNPYKYVLCKLGFFLINDNLTRVNINFVNDTVFSKTVENLSKKPETKHIISGIINDFDINKQIQYISNIKINNSFTNKYLGRILFKWPKINYKYITKYIIYLKSIGYIDL